jgi:hypothetical protein
MNELPPAGHHQSRLPSLFPLGRISRRHLPSCLLLAIEEAEHRQEELGRWYNLRRLEIATLALTSTKIGSITVAITGLDEAQNSLKVMGYTRIDSEGSAMAVVPAYLLQWREVRVMISHTHTHDSITVPTRFWSGMGRCRFRTAGRSRIKAVLRGFDTVFGRLIQAAESEFEDDASSPCRGLCCWRIK